VLPRSPQYLQHDICGRDVCSVRVSPFEMSSSP